MLTVKNAYNTIKKGGIKHMTKGTTMSGCRVEVKGTGEYPVLLIAPHCPEEAQTFEIACSLAEDLDAFMVCNTGWDRGSAVDHFNDTADCNNLNHLLGDDVLKSEFLDPIIRFVSKMRNDGITSIYVYIIHGMNYPGKDKPDIILGGGQDRSSCEPWRLEAFAYSLLSAGLTVGEGAANGRFAGRSKRNLNQLFNKKSKVWYRDPDIHSLQVEIDRTWRGSAVESKVITSALYDAIRNTVNLGGSGFDKEVGLELY